MKSCADDNHVTDRRCPVYPPFAPAQKTTLWLCAPSSGFGDPGGVVMVGQRPCVCTQELMNANLFDELRASNHTGCK